jgi:hypothetical protein
MQRKKVIKNKIQNSSDEELGKNKNYIFNGLKSEFEKFENFIRGEIQDRFNSRGIRYLFTDATVTTQEFALKQMPMSYEGLNQVTLTDPQGAQTVVQITRELRNDRREERKLVKQENDEIIELETEVMRILRKHVNESIQHKFQEFDNDPIQCWGYIETTYGPESRGAQDIVVALKNLLNTRMDNDEVFSNFIINFERKADYCGIPQHAMLGLLQSKESEGNIKLQILPDRLMKDVEESIERNLNYPKFREYLIERDNSQHEQNFQNGKIFKKRAFRASSKDDNRGKDCSENPRNVLCFNCQNDRPHMARDCQLDACGFCEEFKVGHTSFNCPFKQGGKKKKPYDKRNRYRISSDNEDDDDEDEPNRKKKVSKDSKTKKLRFAEDSQEKKRKYQNSPKKDKSDTRRKRVKRVDTKEGEDDDDDSSDDSSNDDSSSNESSDSTQSLIALREGVKPKYLIKRCQMVKHSKSSREINSEVDTWFFIDTGSEEHITKSKRIFTKIFQHYDKDNIPRISLISANGESMKITAKGYINDVVPKAYAVKNADENLLSGKLLQKSGHTLIFPSDFVSPNIGCIIIDHTGKVVLVSGKDLRVDLNSYGSFGNKTLESFMVPIQDLNNSDLYDEDRLSKVFHVMFKGYKPKSIQEKVMFFHNIGHFSKDDMIWMAKSNAIKNFPLTVEQIKKHFIMCECCARGKMRKDSVGNKKLGIVHQLVENVPEEEPVSVPVKIKEESPSPRNIEKPIEKRNVIIGFEVGVDFFGPIQNRTLIVFRDKASGYCTSCVLPKDGKKATPTAIKDQCNFYRKYGHHTKEYNVAIDTLVSDAEAVLKTPQVKEILAEEGIKYRVSPPGAHEYNGLVESSIKTLANTVTAMFAGARHVPESLWTYAWRLAEITQNYRRCKIPNSDITRSEAFKGQKPDFTSELLYPFGQPVIFPIVNRQPGKFTDKSSTGVYLGPSDDTPGCILIYDYTSKRVVCRSSFQLLDHVPNVWTKVDPSFFVGEEANVPIREDEIIDLNTTSEPDAIPKENPTPVVVDVHETNSSENGINVVTSDETDTRITVPTVNVADKTKHLKKKHSKTTPVIHPSVTSTVETTSENAAESVKNMVQSPVPILNSTSTTNGNATAAVSTSKAKETYASVTAKPVPTVIVTKDSPYNLRPNRHNSVLAYETHQIAPLKASEGGSRRLEAPTAQSSEGKVQRSKYIDPIAMGNLFMDPSTKLKKKIDRLIKSYEDTKIQKNPKRVIRSEKNALIAKAMVKKLAKKLKKTASLSGESGGDNPTLNQARSRSDWKEFEKAIEAEYKQMLDEEVYSIIDKRDIPKDVKPIRTMLVLTRKRKPDGSIDKYKARLVVLGNHQESDTYNKIKSPTARSASAKLIISLQAKLGAHSSVFDVKGAYLKSTVKEYKNEKLFIQLPNGQCAKLKKYMYGLKQAGREWYENLSNTLINGGYEQSKADPCVFSKWNGKKFIIMVTHVDDFYVISNEEDKISDLHKFLSKEFGEVTIKSGDLIGYLGMEVSRNPKNGDIKLSQPGYIKKLLNELNYENIRPVSTPWELNNASVKGDDEKVDKLDYLRLLGLLNYLAVFTRPDLLFAMSKAAQACSDPTAGDMRRLKRIFRYLSGTKDYGIIFEGGKEIKLHAYVDASHNCYEDAKGHYGICFTLGKNDGAFYARSSKLKIVTLSSTESEYVAICEAATEVVFIRRLLSDIGFPQNKPTPIYEDNQSCIAMIHGQSNHQKSKHISPKYHYTREQVQIGEIEVKYIKTEEMTADILTKPLGSGQHGYLSRKILNFHFNK